jgi:hypothetical protein
LKYVVIAPDLVTLNEEIDDGLTFGDLLMLIYGLGGRVAIGHFGGDSADESARRLHEVLDYIEREYAPSPYLVLTDHLFNDMPRDFQHAFRTPSLKRLRSSELNKHIDGWTPRHYPLYWVSFPRHY